MITCFPTPYQDEILYSIYARYAERMRYPTKQAIARDVFGNTTSVGNIALAKRLSALIANLPSSQHYSVEKLINDHTLFPVFRPFLSFERLKAIKEDMKDGGNNSACKRAGIVISKYHMMKLSYLHFCPLCIEEDRKAVGECYWHRVHQIPGVEVCPMHKIILHKSLKVIEKGFQAYGFFTAESVVEQTRHIEIDDSDFSQSTLLKFAIDLAWLLQQPNLSCNPASLRQKYEIILTQRGLAHCTPHRKFDIGRLLHELKLHYSGHFLSMLSCELANHEINNWLHQLLYRKDSLIIPLHHLLLIHFLGYDMETFFQLPAPGSPFGEGPWPCLNPTSSHYRQRVINDCSISTTSPSNNKKPKGVFPCECGFVYSRIGPDTCESDSFKTTFILTVGPVWEEAFKRLWYNPTVNLKEMERQLALRSPALKSHAERLGLSFSRPNGLLRQLKKKSPLHLKGGPFDSQVRESYRTLWLNVLQQNPGTGVTFLREKFRKIYRWLYTYDRAWLKAHVPPKPRSNRIYSSFIQWDERDRKTAKAVETIALQMKSANNVPERITKGSIMRNLTKRTTLVHNLFMGKLPLTEQMLNNVVESSEEFIIRRIGWMRDKYLRENFVLPMRSIFARQTGADRYKPSSKVGQAFDVAFQSLKAHALQIDLRDI